MSQWCCYLVTISRIQITEAFEACFRFLHIMWCDAMKLMIRTVCGRAFEDTKFEDGGGIGEASSPGGIWVTVEFLKREIMDIGYWIVIRGTSPFARGARVHYIAPHYCDIVCLSAPSGNFLHVTCGGGSVFLWGQYSTLCSSGLVDDIMF